MSDEPKPFMHDEQGVPWWNFHFYYRFDGHEYAFEIPARSESEAKERLSAMGLARYEGKGHGSDIYVPKPAVGLAKMWLSVWCWCRNQRIVG